MHNKNGRYRVPQITALLNVKKAMRRKKIKIISVEELNFQEISLKLLQLVQMQ